MLYEIKTTKEVDIKMKKDQVGDLVIIVDEDIVAFFNSDGQFVVVEEELNAAGFELDA